MCTMDCECPQNFHQDLQKLGVEPFATVGLSLSSAASRDVSYDSLFTAMELSPLKPWLVKLSKESDRTEDPDLCCNLRCLLRFSLHRVDAERIETVLGQAEACCDSQLLVIPQHSAITLDTEQSHTHHMLSSLGCPWNGCGKKAISN